MILLAKSSADRNSFSGDTRSPSCARCEDSEIDCVREVNVRFRNQTRSGFSRSQTWVSLPEECKQHKAFDSSSYSLSLQCNILTKHPLS